MTINLKNDLQNYFQLRKLPPPTYITKIVGGTDHAPIWRSTISFVLNKKSYKVKGVIHRKKSLAESDAAERALKLLQMKLDKTSVRIDVAETVRATSIRTDVTKMFYKPSSSCPTLSATSSAKRIVMLVDIENVPKWLIKLSTKFPHITEQMDIFGVVGEYHVLAGESVPPGVNKILSPSGRTDGSDSCIQMCVGVFLAQDRYDIYLIATHDKFAHNVVDMITSPGMLWKSQEARVVTRLEHVEPYIS